jgi:hypothetical protein
MRYENSTMAKINTTFFWLISDVISLCCYIWVLLILSADMTLHYLAPLSVVFILPITIIMSFLKIGIQNSVK